MKFLCISILKQENCLNFQYIAEFINKAKKKLCLVQRHVSQNKIY